MAAHGFPEHTSRETRLLLLIVTVSIAVLLLLARLRFPSTGLVAAPEPGPLAGLAGRGTFDDLAEAMNSLLVHVSPRLVAVELSPMPADEGRPGATDHAPRSGDGPGPAPRLALALRVRSDLVLVPVPPSWRPSRLAGTTSAIEVVASSLARQLALVRTTPAPEFRPETVDDGFAGLTYVGVFEATGAGLNIQPTFIGRVAPLTDSRWPGPLLGLTTSGRVAPGTFVFSIDGHLIGLAMHDGEHDVLVPASVLDAAVSELGPDGAPAR